jgi:hypothetical protein
VLRSINDLSAKIGQPMQTVSNDLKQVGRIVTDIQRRTK